MKEVKIEKVNINSIRKNPDNPRVMNKDKFKKLIKSIKDFPQMLRLRPIVVNSEGIILGGNMRYTACMELNHKQVYIIKAEDLTDDQIKQFIIKDNVGFGDWDWDVLANDWSEKDLKDWGLDVWQPDEDEPYSPPDDPFSDEGTGYKSQYGVIVTCETEKSQEEVFKSLSDSGYKCKIVVT